MKENSDYLTKDQLRERLNLPSIRMVEGLMGAKIPYLKLGHKTVRFSWTAVQKALAKLEVQEVGRKN